MPPPSAAGGAFDGSNAAVSASTGSGAGQLEHDGVVYVVGKGDMKLLTAVVGACGYQPHGAVSMLEIAIPEVM